MTDSLIPPPSSADGAADERTGLPGTTRRARPQNSTEPGPASGVGAVSPTTAGRVPAAGDPEPPRRPRRSRWHIPVAAPMILAGVLLVASWVTVNWAIGSSRDAREDARRLAIVTTQADALSETRLVGSSAQTQAQLQRAVDIAVENFGVLAAALGELPPDPGVEALRAQIARTTPAGLRLQRGVRENDVAAVRSSAAALRPQLARIKATSRRLGEQYLEKASDTENVARIASGLALIGGSFGIGLVALSFSRLRQRALVEQTRAEIEERTSTRLDALVSHATDAVMVLDPEGRITWISSTPAFPLARAPQQAIGHFFTDLVHPTDRKRAAQAFTELLGTADLVTTSHLRLATAQGLQRPVEVRGENRLADPAIEGVILTIHDVSERTLLEDQLERLASRDPVTGVANRAQLEAHLQSAVQRRGRRGGFAGLLLVDLDDFRAVSDTLGHDAGDELLRHAARRLEQTAGDGDLVARLDGDTFAVLLDGLRSVGDGQDRAGAILEGLRGRAAVSGGHSVDLDAHGGLAFGAVDLPSREIIRHADIALLEAKSQGVKHVVSFTDQMRNRVTERVELTGDLRRATERDEFEVDYQPIVDLLSGQTVGVEALARWSHPHRGRLSPDTFVDLAEQTGLIRPLGELILRQSCREIAALLERQPGALEYVSVNVSPRQLEVAGLTEVVVSALEDSGLPPECLMLELTERSIASDPERLVERLVELRSLGIKIALDDFGAGYSFMSFLEDYPLDALKIDRSLSKSMAERKDAALLLKGIVEISATANMKVIVEGIETEDQRARAEELGIELGQGFLFSRPVKLDKLVFV